MKRFYTYSLGFLCLLLLAALSSCTKEPSTALTPAGEQGLLRIGIDIEPLTKVTELTSPNQMADSVINGKNYGLYDVGLYIYYTEDYENGIVTNPYIRNMRCTVVDGQLLPVIGPGEDDLNENIYIYDRMTLVAFYPYNPGVEDFQTVADEAKYPITRDIYADQYYIPYRAQTETDPTRAFYTTLYFNPKHTYKLEIVVVSDDLGNFPDPGEIKILPNTDPVNNPDPDGATRAVWFDHPNFYDNTGGGSHVRQYVSYIWTDNEHRNSFPRGEILFSSGKLTLIASQEVEVNEQRVYRYGYNMSTGEIFIPTSSNLVHDIKSLTAIDGSGASSYQVCDIRLEEGGPWTPITLSSGGRFDGGGHRITGMEVSGSRQKGGLFSQIQGSATVCNVNLIDPVIDITFTADTVYAGAICGQVNTPLTAEQKQALIDNLPDNLSEVVKQALLAQMMDELANSSSSIVSCKVTNPTLNVNGLAPRVGTIAGEAANRDETGTYISAVWDTYSLGGSISVNAGNEAANENGYVGGFIGLNNGLIDRSFTTIDDITFNKLVTTTDPGTGLPVTNPEPAYTGFATLGTLFTSAEGGRIDSGFSMLPDDNANVQQFDGSNWPAWGTYTSWWPVLTTGWMSGPSGGDFWYSMGTNPTVYPSLQWERK